MSKKPGVQGMSRSQRAAVMISIRGQQAGRSPRAVSMDARRTANQVLDPETDDLHPWQRHPNRYDVVGVDTRTIEKPKPAPKAKPSKKQSSVKIITKNLPDGYEIRKWSYIENAGKHTVHAAYFNEKPVFGQNKTFKSLTDARKAVKEHASSERSRKRNIADRKQLEEKGYIGKPPKQITGAS